MGTPKAVLKHAHSPTVPPTHSPFHTHIIVTLQIGLNTRFLPTANAVSTGTTDYPADLICTRSQEQIAEETATCKTNRHSDKSRIQTRHARNTTARFQKAEPLQGRQENTWPGKTTMNIFAYSIFFMCHMT